MSRASFYIELMVSYNIITGNSIAASGESEKLPAVGDSGGDEGPRSVWQTPKAQ
jgi:hypothetical protein